VARRTNSKTTPGSAGPGAPPRRSSRKPKKAVRAKPSVRQAPRKAPAKAPRKAPAKAPSKARKASKAKGPAVGSSRRGGLRRIARRVVVLALLLGTALLALDLLWLNELVTERMDGRVHDQPARLVGVAPRLAPGEVATADGWRQTLGALGYEEVQTVRREGQYSMAGASWTIHPRGSERVMLAVRERRVRKIERARDGARLPEARFPLGAVSLLTDESRERRSVVALSDIPQDLQRAVIAIEDERFWKHIGVDPRGIARAAVANLRAGGVAQGGSTLTQQLAKNLFLDSDRSFVRKGQEALLALLLESRYDKERILEAYLNEIYLGQRGGYAVLGVAEAARTWFGKDLGALTLDEAALLAGAIHSPNRTVPWKHPEEAKRRRDQVLRKMQKLAAVPPESIQAALVRPIKAADAPALRRRAAWFVDAVVGELGDRYSPEALHRDGLELVVTLDPQMQDAAEFAIRDGLAALRKANPELWRNGPGPEAALVAIDPRDGAVRALVGGADYGRSQFDRARNAHRQPGSAFKPIVLAAAIDARWPRLRPGSLVLDEPLSVPGAGRNGATWRPGNYDGVFKGPMTLRKATEQSRNLPFVRLGLDVGPDRMRATAERMGIASPLAAVPSLAIGAQEVTPLELAVAYATLASGGQRPTPRFLDGVRDRDGAWLERQLPERVPALDSRVAATVTNVLEGVVDRGTARGVRRSGFSLPLAGKTGTSNDARDAWMVGYTPDLVVAVWVGFDEGRGLGIGSTKAAVPLWARFANAVEPFLSGDGFSRPSGIDLRDDPSLVAPEDPVSLGDEDRERRKAEAEALRAMNRGGRR